MIYIFHVMIYTRIVSAALLLCQIVFGYPSFIWKGFVYQNPSRSFNHNIVHQSESI